MSYSSPTYAEALTLLLDAAHGVLLEHLADELEAAAEANDVTLLPPVPSAVKAGNVRALVDETPCVNIYVVGSRVDPGDALRAGDTLETRMDVVLYVGAETLGADTTVAYTRALYAYTMAIAGLLVRELPGTCRDGTGIFDARLDGWMWDPRLANEAWTAEAPITLVVRQAVRPHRPETES